MKTTPVYLSQFVGRGAELGALGSLIRDESVRLLTLTGPGGAGKTRLAAEMLKSLGDDFEDGIFWVSLAAAADAQAVLHAIIAALQFGVAPGQTPLEALSLFLQHRDAMLVLDNCEHVLQVCAELVNVLLRSCPTLRMLATSRESLQVPGEHVWQVPPLSFPGAAPTDYESLQAFDAVQLFSVRARQLSPAFKLNAENAEDVLRICAVLDGMPLAIELAAGWVNVLEVGDIAERLERQLLFLDRRGSLADHRHRSLRETILWSYDLLSANEQVLFRRLGVFEGGFSADAVEAICDSEPLSREEILVLLGRLIDQSLVVRERGIHGTRCSQLESIRQFAAEKLAESTESKAIDARLLEYYAAYVREAQKHLLGPDQKEWTARLAADNKNLQAALALSLETGQTDTAVEMANGMFWFWNYTERYKEGIDWYERILSHPGLVRDEGAADALRYKGTFEWLLGDYAAAERDLHAAMEAAGVVGNELCIAYADLLLALMSLHRGTVDAAAEQLQIAEERFRRLGEPRGLAIALTNLGGALLEQGRIVQAREMCEQAAEIARASHDLWGYALARMVMGDVVFRSGEKEQALSLIEEALNIQLQIGQNWLAAEALWRMAGILEATGNFDEAVRQLERCFVIARESGAVEWQVAALQSLGSIALVRGDDRQAAALFADALESKVLQVYPDNLARILADVGVLAARMSRLGDAAVLLGAVRQMRSDQPNRDDREPAADERLLRDNLPAADFEQHLLAGGALTPDGAIRLALRITGSFSDPGPNVESPTELRILALGITEVYLDGRLLLPSDWTFAKPKEILLYLALNPPKTKEQIGLVFWPDASPAQLRASLRATLYQLRRALGRRSWILYEHGFYRFNRDLSCWCDVEVFEEKIAQAAGVVDAAPGQAITLLEEAVACYRGDFLEDVTSDGWGVLRREDLRRSYLDALLRLGKLLHEQAAHERALQVFQSALSTDELLEDAHRGIMEAYQSMGQTADALRQYRKLAERLEEELGIEPSSSTQFLFESLGGSA